MTDQQDTTARAPMQVSRKVHNELSDLQAEMVLASKRHVSFSEVLERLIANWRQTHES